MRPLAVIGNMSRDRLHFPRLPAREQLGGAALLVSLAAGRAGTLASPVSLIGDDLPDPAALLPYDHINWTHVARQPGPSAYFDLSYDGVGALRDVRSSFGISKDLTSHAFAVIGELRDEADWHVCCRRPLNAAAILAELAQESRDFSVDFFLPSAATLIAQSSPWLNRASTIFVNAAEYLQLSNEMEVTALREVVVTDGPEPARLFRQGREVTSISPPPCSGGELTGAGDTLAGTYLARKGFGASPAQALADAVEAASAHLMNPRVPIPRPRSR